MAETSPQSSPQQPAKPGTACLGCRRRKLKCSREQEGCSNCTKAELPCVYPAPETGVKRKRGPYKKDKPPRERHLEDLVKYLEPKAAQNEAGGIGLGIHDQEGHSPSTASAASDDGTRTHRLGRISERKPSNSEDLVKDALIALTKSSADNKESIGENGYITAQPGPSMPAPTGVLGAHPPLRQIFEYWHLFTRRVDPLLKILHCPSFGNTLLKAVDDIQNIGPVTESLLFAIYYSAVGSCTNRECRKKFGESREVLLQRYGRVIESALADNYSMPVLESLQALVIYVVCLRRDDSVSNIRALFSLAVRMAQLIGLQEDPGDAFSPFEAEMRRRLWWHICGLESRGAEEGGARQSSIMEDRHVRLPSNLNDYDLDPSGKFPPKPRTGVTDVTWILARFESLRTVFDLFKIRKRYKASGMAPDSPDLKAEQRKVVDEQKLRCETYYLRHLDESRPLDWMCIQWIKLMTIKSRLIVEYPFGQVPTKEMTPQARHELLRSSVEVIRIAHGVSSNKGIEDWLWYFRGWVQWHSIAIVIAELGGNKNQQFVNTAWAVLDPILADWDNVYRAKKDEAAWVHVNALIEKARQIRRQMPTSQYQNPETAQTQSGSTSMQRPTLHQDYNTAFSTGQTEASSVIGLVPESAWQSEWLPSNGLLGMSPETIVPQHQQVNESTPTQRQYQTIPTPASVSGLPFLTGCAPSMDGLDLADFGYIEGLDNIDFSAFDAVFKDMAWDFSSPSTDPNVETFNMLPPYS